MATCLASLSIVIPFMPPAGDDGSGRGQVARQIERTGQIVSGAQRQDAEWQTSLDQGIENGIQRAVATPYDDEIDPLAVFCKRLLQAAVIVGGYLDHLDVRSTQHIERRAQVCIALPTPLVDQDQR